MTCAVCSRSIWSRLDYVDISVFDEDGEGEECYLHPRCAYDMGLPVCAMCGGEWENASDHCDACHAEMRDDARLARAGL